MIKNYKVKGRQTTYLIVDFIEYKLWSNNTDIRKYPIV